MVAIPSRILEPAGCDRFYRRESLPFCDRPIQARETTTQISKLWRGLTLLNEAIPPARHPAGPGPGRGRPAAPPRRPRSRVRRRGGAPAAPRPRRGAGRARGRGRPRPRGPGGRLLDRWSHGGSIPQGGHNTALGASQGDLLKPLLRPGRFTAGATLTVGWSPYHPRRAGIADGLVERPASWVCGSPARLGFSRSLLCERRTCPPP
jgi:hypothetical protein